MLEIIYDCKVGEKLGYSRHKLRTIKKKVSNRNLVHQCVSISSSSYHARAPKILTKYVYIN